MTDNPYLLFALLCCLPGLVLLATNALTWHLARRYNVTVTRRLEDDTEI